MISLWNRAHLDIKCDRKSECSRRDLRRRMLGNEMMTMCQAFWIIMWNLPPLPTSLLFMSFFSMNESSWRVFNLEHSKFIRIHRVFHTQTSVYNWQAWFNVLPPHNTAVIIPALTSAPNPVLELQVKLSRTNFGTSLVVLNFCYHIPCPWKTHYLGFHESFVDS